MYCIHLSDVAPGIADLSLRSGHPLCCKLASSSPARPGSDPDSAAFRSGYVEVETYMCVLPVCKFIAPSSVRNSFHWSARVAASIILAPLILPASAETQISLVTYDIDNART